MEKEIDKSSRPVMPPPELPTDYIRVIEEYVAGLRQESKDNWDKPGKVYWVPSRMLHPVYRKGDGFWKWLKCKWWDWKDKR